MACDALPEAGRKGKAGRAIDPAREAPDDGAMTDLSKPWPLGLGTRLWWMPVLAGVVLLGLVAFIDAPVSIWSRSWPDGLHDFFAAITNLGLGDWILWPAAVLCVATAILARFVRWPLMRTMLWQFVALYAFIFLGVGVPSLVSTIVKRLIGRGRPIHLIDTGLFGFRPNWLDWTYQSFPSGHATTIFSMAMVVGFLSPRLYLPAMAVAVAVGVSRISVLAHYPTDVIGGAMLGVVGAYAVRWYFARRGWLFVRDAAGRIHSRPMLALTRYLSLKRRGIAPAPRPGRS